MNVQLFYYIITDHTLFTLARDRPRSLLSRFSLIKFILIVLGVLMCDSECVSRL